MIIKFIGFFSLLYTKVPSTTQPQRGFDILYFDMLYFFSTDESLYSGDSLEDFWLYGYDSDDMQPNALFYGNDALVCIILSVLTISELPIHFSVIQ